MQKEVQEQSAKKAKIVQTNQSNSKAVGSKTPVDTQKTQPIGLKSKNTIEKNSISGSSSSQED